ncbi:MAG: FAD-binding protein, partial [Mailhella sp.]
MNIIERPLLSSLTTLRIGGRALAEIQLFHKEDCLHLPDVLAKLGGQVHILGGGSNLLIHDGDLPITVLRPFFGSRELHENEAEIISEEQGGTHKLIRVGSGMRIPHLLKWCALHGLSGLEGLVGIPSRMGGAIAMNAGAYGCSMAPLLRALDVFTPEKGLHTVTSEDWTASYRHFSLHD